MKAIIRRLGLFAPSELRSEVIETEIRPYLPPCCQRERVSVRVPHPQAADPHPNNLEWHQDGGGPLGTTHHMVVWASEQPTEIVPALGGAIFPSVPGELIWYDNTIAWHRQPRGTDETRRWFVAIRCSGALT